MPGFLMRGALVEYASDFLGPLPNIIVFQFNPEQMSRTLRLSPADREDEEGNGDADTGQSSGPPSESLSITAHFSAVDDIGSGGAGAVIPSLFGVGPQLAALEKMVYPEGGLISEAIGAAVDAIGDALGIGGDEAGKPVPRDNQPKILFIWGPFRILPVRIESMSITEKQYDNLLNPILAEVQIGLKVLSLKSNSLDAVAKGALTYTGTVKEVQAAANLVQAAALAIDIVTF
jgi:hypothetical protein